MDSYKQLKAKRPSISEGLINISRWDWSVSIRIVNTSKVRFGQLRIGNGETLSEEACLKDKEDLKKERLIFS
jgi:hypothetical protein